MQQAELSKYNELKSIFYLFTASGAMPFSLNYLVFELEWGLHSFGGVEDF
jgi:hypothetical protein